MQQKRVTTPDGTVHIFPAEATEEMIAAVLGVGQQKAPQTPQTTNDGRTVLGDLLDVGKGFAKGAGRTGLSLATMAATQLNPALRLYGTPDPDLLKPTNLRQTQGMAGFDLASLAMPGTQGSRLKLLPRVGEALEHWAVPGFTRQMASQALEHGAGPVTQGSAKALKTAAKESPQESSIMVQRFGKWVPKETKPSKLQPVADAMQEAADAPLIKRLLGPLPKSIAAQGLYSAGPALQGIAGGAGGAAAALLYRLLSGGRD